jgi:hypothetical protein
MRAPRLALVALPLATLVAAGALAACGGAAPSPSPSPSPNPTDPADAVVRLRVTTVQALPPAATFGRMPQIVITLDGRVLTGGAIPAVFPGPLLMPVFERPISAAGWDRVVAAARAAGLLGAVRDFTGGQMPPGSAATRLELVADGRIYDLTGDASRVMVCVTTPCVPAPGTPEAFGGFVNSLSDLATLAGAENLGPERVHEAAGYAVVVGPAPDQQGLPQPPIAWPLDGGFASFGRPLADGSGGRCGTITGADLGFVRPAFAAATSITRGRDPVDGTFRGLQVQSILPGDGDPCEGLV